jgi:DNA polymerase type B, organellar and viral
MSDQGQSLPTESVARDAAAARVAALLAALGPEQAAVVEARRERARARMRELRRQQTPEQIEREAERKRKARASKPPLPFMAIDGEGGGTDACERQNYNLMIAVSTEHEFVLNTGSRLTTTDCFGFILDLPKDAILVAFGLGYDATQILRDLPSPVLRRIYDPYHNRHGGISPEYWRDYAIQYMPGKYLKIGLVDNSVPVEKGKRRPVVKNSYRTIYETFAFFQCSFAKAIENWKTGTEEERRVITLTKDQRNTFEAPTPKIIAYCKLECRHLVEMMTNFRELCHDLDIRPQQWSGPGEIAAVLLAKRGVPKRPRTAKESQMQADRKPAKNPRPDLRRSARDSACEIILNAAYYGGRFETSCIGRLPDTVYQYDQNSAYPAAMLRLPCPLHTKWVHSRHKSLPTNGELYVARITFTHPDGTRWCGLPFRTKSGGLIFPMHGTGTYWSPEIEAAQQHVGARIVKVHDLWIAKCECDCPQYDWIHFLFDERNRLGKNGRGYPLKLGLNALYGKLAQRRVGRAPFHDAAAAGLITAIARARLLEAIGHDPEAIVMIATDAVFSKRPLPIDIGNGLGQWGYAEHPDLFITQPGVYFSPTELKAAADSSDVIKSRGVKRAIIGKAAPLFLKTFDQLYTLMRDPEKRAILLRERKFHEVPVTVHVFYGHKLALARGKPILAGKWEDVTRIESFEWASKRDPFNITVNDDGSISTFPIVGRLTLESKGYEPTDFDKLLKFRDREGEEFEEDDDTLLEAQPDFTEFLPHE